MTELKSASAPKSQMHLRIVSAEEAIFSDDVAWVNVNGCEGSLGIMPGHSPLLTLIPAGNVTFLDITGKHSVVNICGGVLEVQPASVTVLADTAIRVEDIDESRALEAKRQAEERLSKAVADHDFTQALSELSRALSQLQAVEISRKGRFK
jgi:F-type H+-transporting ATPase subunit epsilon